MNISIFKQLATRAAMYERAGDFEVARNLWRKAYMVSVHPANEDWCQIRARLCELEMKRIFDAVVKSVGGAA